MGGKWLVVLPLLVDFNMVILQPVTREVRHLDQRDCCPCPDSMETDPGGRSRDGSTADFSSSCLRHSLPDDAEPAASILLPALRAIQPFVKQPDQKAEPKPLLQPEVGLASSVLETLRQATDEEYQEARARDAARSAVKLIESTLDPLHDDTLMDSPKNIVRIFLNKQRDGDDMDDNLPEPSHIQETRCIHSPLTRPLKVSRPTPIIELIELPPKPTRRLNNKSVLHRKFHDMDNGISASNIKERVMQADIGQNLERVLKTSPGLSLFPNTNLKESEDRKGLKKNLGDESNQREKTKPNLNLKLRELIDNLEKAKVPLIDFNKHIFTTARTPTLKLSPIDKSMYSRPFVLKDLLKLKDVELIPQKSLTKSTVGEKHAYPSLKLQSQNFNADVDNCKELNSNLVPLMSNDNEIVSNPNDSDILDTDSSPTNSNPVFELKSNEVDIQQNVIPVESIASSENSGEISISTDIEDQDNFDDGEVKHEQDSHKEKLLSDHCNGATGNSFMQPDDNKNSELNEHGPVRDLEDTEDKSLDESNNGAFPITYIEDFDMPIEFDNSSFTSNLKNNENVPSSENTLNDPIADTSNNALQIVKPIFESPTGQETRKEVGIDCNSQENFSKNTNFISEQLSDTDRSLLEEVPSEEDLNFANGANDFISNKNYNPNDISFRDLQDMSDSILSLSECAPPKEENNNNLNENINQINDDYDGSDIPTSVFDTNSKETDTDNAPDIETSFNSNSELNDVSNIDSIEKLCKSTAFDETPSDIKQSDIKQPMQFSPDIENSEMRADASAPESIKSAHRYPSFKNTVEDDKKSNIFTKDTPNKNNIPKLDQHSIFLNNLKSKLTGLFSTPEKVNDCLNTSADNANESSNNNPIVALPRFDKFKNLENLQLTPQTLLSKIALPELPRTAIHPFKNILASPNNLNEHFMNDPLNLFSFPKSFDDILDPSPTFNAFSDTIRSHTENTIKNVKDTLESTLKDSQSFRLSSPTDTIDIHDVLGSISERHDEMKDKLEAINLDLNDRFSSFHQSIVDHFKVPSRVLPEFQKERNNGKLRASHIPMRKELPITAASNLRNVEQEHPLLSNRINVPKKGKTTEIKILSQKPHVLSDEPRIRNSDKKLQKPMYSTTTSLPSFVTRPKVLKTNIGATPRIPSQAMSKTRPTENIMPEEKVTKFKPLSLKSQRTNDHSDQYNPPRPSSKINLPMKSFKTNTEKIDKNNLSLESPVDKLRKAFLNKNVNEKFRNDLKKNLELGTKNAFKSHNRPETEEESFASRIQDGRPRMGSRHNDGLITSATSQKESGLRVVEPLRENVPYKCKLICYKD